MTYIMSCVWLDYMVKYFQCKNCVGSSLKTKKCVASFLVPGDRKKHLRKQVLFCDASLSESISYLYYSVFTIIFCFI